MRDQICRFIRLFGATIAVWPTMAGGNVPSVNQPFQPGVLERPSPVAIRELKLPPADPLTAPLEFTVTERQLLLDAEDGRLDEHSLIEAALIAGGAGDLSKIKIETDRFAVLRDELLRHCSTETDTLTRTELIHQFLHDRVLRKFRADITDLTATFDTGIYNCASATLLFVALAADVGITVQALELPGHVRAAVGDGANRWEIEITTSNWGEAIRRLESRAADRRYVSPIGLVAMIYYNQGIDAFHERRFAAAIAANRRALLLDPESREARGNLLAAVNNWALALCESGRFDAAESLLAAGIKFDAKHAAFLHNAAYVRKARATGTQ
ncbi:MAG: hypothetical protein IT427_14255 [Pirellulales bacterium]|nr:hypothetical protein [Pirellulales bacterium]